MTIRTLQGRAHVYGDHIDTDAIIAGKYTKTLDLNKLAQHVLEDLDPEFRNKVRTGDFLVAGVNFGCGSSREQAPLALKTAGVAAVLARSFARIFYRNAINIGLPVVEVDTRELEDGAELRVDLAVGVVEHLGTGRVYRATPLPTVMLAVLQAGGLAPYLREHGDYRLPG
ncbi:MAG: 3-isopropylmalate dehydratase small subunit [Desulfomicrobiaceae bacterium]|nr:3-isopropylmalate dehydratase small subunit [Desulfomicrobiaceae bacterium]